MVLGIDIGGTDIKFGVVNDAYQVLARYRIPTPGSSSDLLLESVIRKCMDIQKDYPIDRIGIGSPGTLDCRRGICLRCANLPYKNTPLKAALQQALKLPVILARDATCAVWGEYIAGYGSDYKSLLVLTLGTGIGGGAIIDGRLLQGQQGGAGEFGHMILQENGLPCGCGQHGCYEKYASVSALIRQTRDAVRQNPGSILAMQSAAGITGKTAFEAQKLGCSVAETVIHTYIGHLAAGIKSLVRIFQPEAVALTGGITSQGDDLLVPLRQQVSMPVEIYLSELRNDAGIIGAAALALREQKQKQEETI